MPRLKRSNHHSELRKADMSENQNDWLGYNRRDFLRSGSVATVMAMMGGVPLIARTEPAPEESSAGLTKTKVALIGLGGWGREILNALMAEPLASRAEVAAICDNYPASLKRAATAAPGAIQTADYKTILANKDIPLVIVATATHQHKDIVLDALKAGKHVYCEAPLANNLEDAKAIALAARDAKELIFQPGLHLRSDPERHFLLPFIRSGALGTVLMARSQWHKKISWRSASPNPEREKAINWRLDKSISLGLMGEIGIHQIDQACLFLNGRPRAVTGHGTISFWKDDGRDVADTVLAAFEFPAGVTLSCDCTLANSFDAAYDVFYGSDAAVMLRDNKAWMFKEVDSPLLGWEVYAKKDIFYKETGIALVANASKSVMVEKTGEEPPFSFTALSHALEAFVRNAGDYVVATKDYVDNISADDKPGLIEQLTKTIQKRPAAGFLEGYQATVTAIKTNEAVQTGQRIELKRELYELA
jgi:predicted dehydrogenase